jgi:electron transfer flavoprotein alpha subunit
LKQENMPDIPSNAPELPAQPLIVVLAETSWGKLERVTLELLSDARKLAVSRKGRVEILLLCAPEQTVLLLTDLAGTLREPVHLVEHGELAEFSTEPYLSTIVQVLQELRPTVLFMAATANGRGLGPRLAARLGYAYFPHCLLVKPVAGDKLEITRVTHSGRVHVLASWPAAEPAVLTMKPGVADVAAAEKGTRPELSVTKHAVVLKPGKVKMLRRIPADPKTLDIREAERLVSGGRGVGGKEGFNVMRSLAEALGASLAASRAAVDLGWIEYERQVGQTGKAVTPRLYLAAGISGASHHLMGMRDSEKIVALNSDRKAPIFSVAHFGVLGDLHAVVPRLTERILQGRVAPSGTRPAADAGSTQKGRS